MKELTCVIIGGGYAGIHAVKAIRKRVQSKKYSLRIVLINPSPYHIRKVLLFKPAAQEAQINVPLDQILPKDVNIIQGYVSSIQYKDKTISVLQDEGKRQLINYDIVVIAVGSTFPNYHEKLGGISLSSPENAQLIHEHWRSNLELAKQTEDPEERKRFLTITVIGAGISGIETSALLTEQIRKTASTIGLNQEEIRVLLINSKDRLFVEGTKKLSEKLERKLNQMGVEVLHNEKAVSEKDGNLELQNGNRIPTGLSVWTTGLVPNPCISSWELPLTEDGRLIVDSSYRVISKEGIYCIGDCAQIIAPSTEREDMMTCKEATIQAGRLGRIINADLYNQVAPVHRTPITTFCFGFGEKQGLVWVGIPKINLYLSGKVGYWIRKKTWDIASLIK